MRERWERTGVITRLLVAIFGNLSRRAWWAYHGRPDAPAPPRIAVVARRPTERTQFVPQVTAAWRAVAAAALPVEATGISAGADGAPLPTVWLDAAERPDIADLPRVLNGSRDAPTLATQWLADLDAGHCFLVTTFAEPVAASWAVRFDLPEHVGLLEQIAGAGTLVVALDRPPAGTMASGQPDAARAPRHTLWLPVTSTTQLRAILGAVNG